MRTAYPTWSNEKKLFDAPKQNDGFKNEFKSSKFDDKPEEGYALKTLVSSFHGNKTINIEPSTKEQKSAIQELVINMSKGSDNFSKTIIEKPKEIKQTEENETIKKLVGIMKPASSSVKFEDELPKTPPINMETNLLQEYEKHIKRQDLDTMNQTASSTINFDMENTNNQLNKMGTWSQLGNMNNIDELPKASSTAKEELNFDLDLNKNGLVEAKYKLFSLFKCFFKYKALSVDMGIYLNLL